jgi:hypothetical protein
MLRRIACTAVVVRPADEAERAGATKQKAACGQSRPGVSPTSESLRRSETSAKMTRAPEGLVLLRNPNDIDLERTYDIKRGPLHVPGCELRHRCRARARGVSRCHAPPRRSSSTSPLASFRRAPPNRRSGLPDGAAGRSRIIAERFARTANSGAVKIVLQADARSADAAAGAYICRQPNLTVFVLFVVGVNRFNSSVQHLLYRQGFDG